jgi:hypothetical protein
MPIEQCVTGLIVATLFLPHAFALAAEPTSQRSASSVPEVKILKEPLTISMSVDGRFAQGSGWWLSVNSAGQADLIIRTYPQPARHQFGVSADDLVALRQVLLDEAFFDLKDEYGEPVVDGSTTTLTICAGDVAKTVKLRFLMNWVTAKDSAKLRDPARAVRVATFIRGWFEDSAAVDLRKYDAMALKAASAAPDPAR